MKQAVPADTESRISEKAAMGREAWKRGSIAEAEEHFLEVWELLPEPKTECDYYAQSLSRGLVTFYQETKQFEKAKHWLSVMREAYGPEPNDSVEFLAATVYFDEGNLDGAFRMFDSQFKKYRRRPFQGKDKKYLDFYLQRAATKK